MFLGYQGVTGCPPFSLPASATYEFLVRVVLLSPRLRRGSLLTDQLATARPRPGGNSSGHKVVKERKSLGGEDAPPHSLRCTYLLQAARLTRNPPVQGVVSRAAAMLCRPLRAGVVGSRGLGRHGGGVCMSPFPSPAAACFATWPAVLVKASLG